MALHLGKKLAQVLSGSSGSNSGIENSNVGVATSGAKGTSSLPMQENLTCGNAITGTSELFNIAKAKRIELPSLSSRLVATTPISIDPKTNTSTQISASTDGKHLSTVQSPNMPIYDCSATTNNTTSIATETQSTVIISFKSSQVPVQSQSTLLVAGSYEHPKQHHHSEQQYDADTVNTHLNNKDKITLPHSPSLFLSNSSHISTTAQLGNPICASRAPKSNVLKKVASFTIEKSSSSGSSICKNNNGDSNTSMLGQLNSVGSKRSTFVPEKLNFAAYEKFEGQMLMKWLLSSLKNNCNHLSEHDVNLLTTQYCNSLINVGVLKQISEKNYLETFNPFQMYQWTHTEASTTSKPHTPGKLDKLTSWPYSSTQSSGITRISKVIPVDTTETCKENYFTQMLRKSLLSCSSVCEVHDIVNEMLPVSEPSRGPLKRCVLLTDLSNTIETALYQHEKNNSEMSSGCESGVQDAGVETEKVSQSIKVFICRNCKQNKEYVDFQDKIKCDKEIQVYLSEENQNINLMAIKSSGSKATLAQLPPPPPPPPPSFIVPPPPPPQPSSGSPPNTSNIPIARISTTSVSSPSAPTSIKSCKISTPAPLPNPVEGGWFNQANTLRKTAVNPPKPMKPLYWTRIVTQPSLPMPAKVPASVAPASCDRIDSSTPIASPYEQVITKTSSSPKEIWQEIDETDLDNIDEFTELFSREAIAPKVVPKIKSHSKPIKILDSKRSQNVGILLRSSHVDFCEIEHAISHVDTSIVSLETLQQINKNKATNEELERIKEQGDIQLDEPEQFLLKISQISMFGERISCMVFMAEFEETTTIIERKLEVVMKLSQFLMESEELKLIFTIILTLGNYMNGGNRQRGQADGFTLEILSKLKDVKSKDSQTTLLHFIVRTYIGRKRKEGVQLLEIPLPIPEPSDVERAAQVEFDEVKGQIKKLRSQLSATEKIIMHSSDIENIEPFKSKMEKFIKNASQEIDKLLKELDDCSKVFINTMKFYHYIPRNGTLEHCTPNKFFEHWTNFTNDFKDIMKKEIAVLWNDLLKKAKNIKTRTAVKTTKVTPGCLKERMLRLQQKKWKE